ncbi:MAG TPA: putative DNA-binding domain-containing protein [Nannocystis sp.]
MSDEALLRAFAASLIELDAPRAVAGDLRSFLAGRGVPDAAIEAMPPVAAARLSIYRTMVHKRIREAVAAFLPKTAARLGRPRLMREIARWIADTGPRSPYFWRLTGEFVAWAERAWPDDPAIPAGLLDLARHEWSDAEVRNNPAGGEPASGLPLALDRPVQFDGTVVLRRYAFAVLRATERGEVEPGPTNLLMYRDRDNLQVRTLELTPRAAAVTARLLAGETLQAALTGACAELEIALDDEFLAAMAAYLADLAERKALLGAVP